jgi:hypothetical protein
VTEDPHTEELICLFRDSEPQQAHGASASLHLSGSVPPGAHVEPRWYSWDEITALCALLDLPTTPVVYRGLLGTENDLSGLLDTLSKQQSCIGGAVREGFVVRHAEEFPTRAFADHVAKVCALYTSLQLLISRMHCSM